MTNLIRIIEDPAEVEAARQGAAFEFLDEMDRDPEAARRVSPAMLEHWWGMDHRPAVEPEPNMDHRDLWERRIP